MGLETLLRCARAECRCNDASCLLRERVRREVWDEAYKIEGEQHAAAQQHNNKEHRRRRRRSAASNENYYNAVVLK